MWNGNTIVLPEQSEGERGRKGVLNNCEAIEEEQWELGSPDEWVERVVLQDRIG